MTEEQKTLYKRLGIAAFAGLAVALGVFFEAIPIDFIVSIFQQPK